jgi:predicted nucleic acid-binding protein
LQLLDTIVLVGSLNVESEHHSPASSHLSLLNKDAETFVPLTTLLEFDLVLKSRNYTFNQRRDAFDWLSNFVPEAKIVPGSLASLKISTQLEESGMSYFDSLISGIAIERDATVLTPDKEISKVVKTLWWRE